MKVSMTVRIDLGLHKRLNDAARDKHKRIYNPTRTAIVERGVYLALVEMGEVSEEDQ